MVTNSFTCCDCATSYAKEKDAVECEGNHENQREERAREIKKNKKMVFSKNAKVTKKDLDDQFGGVEIKFKEKYDLIILMGNSGGGLRPYKCLLPHQVYVNDLREAFEEHHFEVICIVGIESSNVFPIAYKDGYGFQRWGDMEPKDDVSEAKDKVKGLCPCGHVHLPYAGGRGFRTYCVEGSQCNSDKCKDFVSEAKDGGKDD